MPFFALVEAAGNVPPGHMKAIHAVGGDLKVAYDPNGSVGDLTAIFRMRHFFTESERVRSARRQTEAPSREHYRETVDGSLRPFD